MNQENPLHQEVKELEENLSMDLTRWQRPFSRIERWVISPLMNIEGAAESKWPLVGGIMLTVAPDWTLDWWRRKGLQSTRKYLDSWNWKD